MAYYEEIDDIINKAVMKLLENQNICKLVSLYPDVDTFTFDPLSEPDIEDTYSLLLEHIYPMPKDYDTTYEQKGFITCVVSGSNTFSDNQGFVKLHLVFDIIFHLKSWLIKGGLRPYKVAHEIDKMFNNKNGNFPIGGKFTSLPFRVKSYSTSYYGLQLIYEFVLNSNIDCNLEIESQTNKKTNSYLENYIGNRRL